MDKTYDEVAFALNLDHSIIFETNRGFWKNVKSTCDQQNAKLFQPEEKTFFEDVISKYANTHYHIGMYWENEWKSVKGTKVTKFFWAEYEPNNPKTQPCGGATHDRGMVDLVCDTNIRNGLCIY